MSVGLVNSSVVRIPWFNLTKTSRKGTWVVDISAVNLMVGCALLIKFMNRSSVTLASYHTN